MTHDPPDSPLNVFGHVNVGACLAASVGVSCSLPQRATEKRSQAGDRARAFSWAEPPWRAAGMFAVAVSDAGSTIPRVEAGNPRPFYLKKLPT